MDAGSANRPDMRFCMLRALRLVATRTTGRPSSAGSAIRHLTAEPCNRPPARRRATEHPPPRPTGPTGSRLPDVTPGRTARLDRWATSPSRARWSYGSSARPTSGVLADRVCRNFLPARCVRPAAPLRRTPRRRAAPRPRPRHTPPPLRSLRREPTTDQPPSARPSSGLATASARTSGSGSGSGSGGLGGRETGQQRTRGIATRRPDRRLSRLRDGRDRRSWRRSRRRRTPHRGLQDRW